VRSGQIDVLIIGAGVAGLTATRGLAKARRRVLIVEARDRLGGASIPCINPIRRSNWEQNSFTESRRNLEGFA